MLGYRNKHSRMIRIAALAFFFVAGARAAEVPGDPCKNHVAKAARLGAMLPDGSIWIDVTTVPWLPEAADRPNPLSGRPGAIADAELRSILEASLESPDDLVSRRALGDYLLEKGEASAQALGELIHGQLHAQAIFDGYWPHATLEQLRLEDAARARELLERSLDLLGEWGGHWLAPFNREMRQVLSVDKGTVYLVLRRGLVEGIVLADSQAVPLGRKKRKKLRETLPAIDAITFLRTEDGETLENRPLATLLDTSWGRRARKLTIDYGDMRREDDAARFDERAEQDFRALLTHASMRNKVSLGLINRAYLSVGSLHELGRAPSLESLRELRLAKMDIVGEEVWGAQQDYSPFSARENGGDKRETLPVFARLTHLGLEYFGYVLPTGFESEEVEEEEYEVGGPPPFGDVLSELPSLTSLTYLPRYYTAVDTPLRAAPNLESLVVTVNPTDTFELRGKPFSKKWLPKLTRAGIELEGAFLSRWIVPTRLLRQLLSQTSRLDHVWVGIFPYGRVEEERQHLLKRSRAVVESLGAKNLPGSLVVEGQQLHRGQ